MSAHKKQHYTRGYSKLYVWVWVFKRTINHAFSRCALVWFTLNPSQTCCSLWMWSGRICKFSASVLHQCESTLMYWNTSLFSTVFFWKERVLLFFFTSKWMFTVQTCHLSLWFGTCHLAAQTCHLVRLQKGKNIYNPLLNHRFGTEHGSIADAVTSLSHHFRPAAFQRFYYTECRHMYVSPYYGSGNCTRTIDGGFPVIHRLEDRWWSMEMNSVPLRWMSRWTNEFCGSFPLLQWAPPHTPTHTLFQHKSC